MAKEPKQDAAQTQPRRDGMAIRVRQAREKKGLSLADLHKTTGLSRSALHDYESGRTKPGARELLLICECLEVTPNWLLCGTEEPLKRRAGLKSLVKLKSSPAMMALVSMMLLPILFAALDEDDIDAILTLVASMLHAKDPKMSEQLSVVAHEMSGLLGDGSPAALEDMARKAKDPKFMQELQDRIAAKLNLQ